MKVGLWSCALAVVLAAPVFPQTTTNSGFAKLKALEGAWEGKTQDGKKAVLTYQVVSAGSALMETLATEGESAMITMYHLDGERLLMTHYCTAGNQPRMKSPGLSADGKQIAFDFQDVTNFSGHDSGHMVKMVLKWKDDTHIQQAWTWRDISKKDQTEVFEFDRKR